MLDDEPDSNDMEHYIISGSIACAVFIRSTG